MRFDMIFIAFGALAGLTIAELGVKLPQIRVVPALMWLLGAILVFDVASAAIRRIPVVYSVGLATRLIAFAGGVLALMLSGSFWG
jgi:uncharacterized membrane-anchored protein